MAAVSSSSCSSDPTSSHWATDSNNDELDLELKPAQLQAKQEYLDGVGDQNGPLAEPIILRNLLSDEQIDKILKEASAEGVWPRGLYKDGRKDSASADEKRLQDSSTSSTIGKSPVPRSQLSKELLSAPHHFAWNNGHVVLYMHNDNHWFVRKLTEAWSVIRGGMEARSWMNGAIPVLEMGFICVGAEAEDPSLTQVRTVELHHYGPGGGLITPGHRDCGSELTISVLLSDSEGASGGDFVTYDKGVPVAHKLNRGDAILFNSMSLHNISTITAGLRKSLVVELWPSKRC